MKSESSSTGAEAAFDSRLRQALSDLPPAADTHALQQRVLAGWPGQTTEVAARSRGWRQRRWVMGGAGLACGLLLAVGLWVNQPDDAVLQELMQPDVLSQMAADQI